MLIFLVTSCRSCRTIRPERHEVTRKISMATRKELVAALQLRYSSAAFGDRIKILDEFVALTGYHRKHAIRLLREKASTTQGTPARNRLYHQPAPQPLIGFREPTHRI